MTDTTMHPLADVLWAAANTLSTRQFSCIAARSECLRAMNMKYTHDNDWDDPACNFLRSLGCDPKCCHFSEFSEGEQRQGVRYMWLLLAMHVADDEGIMVKVRHD